MRCGTPSRPRVGDPHPPVLRKTGPHPPPGARTRPPLPVESRRSGYHGTQNRRGGGYPSLSMTGGYPSPAQKKEEGAPPPRSFKRQAPTPPPVACTRARLRMELRRRRDLPGGKMAGGVGAPHVPGGVPTPPPLLGKRGTPLPLVNGPGGGSRGVTQERASRCRVAGREA